MLKDIELNKKNFKTKSILYFNILSKSIYYKSIQITRYYIIILIISILCMQIILKSIEQNLRSKDYVNIIQSLTIKLSKVFENHKFIQRVDSTNFPLELFNRQRNQWIFDLTLDWLLAKYKPCINTKILAKHNFDAYSDGLNSVL